MFFKRNIAATVNLSCILNLKDIALRAKNTEYNPKRFGALIMRIRSTRISSKRLTALIFKTGLKKLLLNY